MTIDTLRGCHPIDVAAKAVGSLAEVARVLGVTKASVHQWKLEKRQVPLKHCVAIEQATNRAVTRRDLRPDDWHRIWPELITEEYPAPATEAA